MNPEKANAFRHFVHDVLISAAILRRIDYMIEVDTSIMDEVRDKLGEPLRNIVSDIVYFRSSSRSLCSVKEFRLIIDNLFYGYDLVWYGDYFAVNSMMQKFLREYPFPKEFYRPLSYPYVEYHNGKEKTLCVTKKSLENLLNQEEPSLAN